MRTRRNRCHTLPSLVLLVPSRRRRDHIWPSFSSLRSENEVTNVVDDGLACFDCCLARIVQDGLEGVVTRQLICPCIASGREAASIIQLGFALTWTGPPCISLQSRCGLHPQCLGAFALLCTISVHVPGPGGPLHRKRRTSLLTKTM